jgi:hypothetical protein
LHLADAGYSRVAGAFKEGLMNRRKLAVTGVLVAALAVVLVIVVSKAPDDRGGTGHAVGSGTTGSQPPNILILIADDVGVDKVNSYARTTGPRPPTSPRPP